MDYDPYRKLAMRARTLPLCDVCGDTFEIKVETPKGQKVLVCAYCP